MADERDILMDGEGAGSSGEERRLETLLAQMPRRRSPARVRANVLAALRAETESAVVKPAVVAESAPGAKTVTVWFRKRLARTLEVAAALLVVVVGIQLYLKVGPYVRSDRGEATMAVSDRNGRGEFAPPPAGAPIAGKAGTLGGEPGALVPLTGSAAAQQRPSAIGEIAGRLAEAKAKDGAARGTVVSGEQPVREAMRQAREETVLALQPPDDAKKPLVAQPTPRTAEDSLKSLADDAYDKPEGHAEKPKPPRAVADALDAPVRAKARSSDREDRQRALNQALAGQPVDDFAAAQGAVGAAPPSRNGVALQTESAPVAAPAAPGLATTAAMSVIAKEAERIERAPEVAIAAGDIDDTARPGESGRQEMEQKAPAAKEGDVPALGRFVAGVRAQDADHGGTGGFAAGDLVWLEVQSSPSIQMKYLESNTIDSIEIAAQAGRVAGPQDEATTWTVFRTNAVAAFNGLVNDFGGVVNDSRDVVVNPGNRPAVLVECAVPESNGDALMSVVNQKRIAAVRTTALAPTTGLNGRATSGGRVAGLYRFAPAQPMQRTRGRIAFGRLSETDLENGGFSGVVNFFVQAPPPEQNQSLWGRRQTLRSPADQTAYGMASSTSPVPLGFFYDASGTTAPVHSTVPETLASDYAATPPWGRAAARRAPATSRPAAPQRLLLFVLEPDRLLPMRTNPPAPAAERAR